MIDVTKIKEFWSKTLIITNCNTCMRAIALLLLLLLLFFFVGAKNSVSVIEPYVNLISEVTLLDASTFEIKLEVEVNETQTCNQVMNLYVAFYFDVNQISLVNYMNNNVSDVVDNFYAPNSSESLCRTNPGIICYDPFVGQDGNLKNYAKLFVDQIAFKVKNIQFNQTLSLKAKLYYYTNISCQIPTQLKISTSYSNSINLGFLFCGSSTGCLGSSGDITGGGGDGGTEADGKSNSENQQKGWIIAIAVVLPVLAASVCIVIVLGLGVFVLKLVFKKKRIGLARI